MSVNQIPGSGAGYIGTTAGAPADAAVRKGSVGTSPAQEIDSKVHIAKGVAVPGGLPAPGASGTPSGAPGDAAKALAALSPKTVEADMYAVMALFQKMAQEQRNSARQVRDSELQAQVGTLMKAADEIRNAAQERFVGAVVAGSLQIAGGVAQAGMAGASFRMSSSAGLSKTGTSDAANAINSRAGALTGMGQGASQAMGGIGSIVNASQELKASAHDAKKAELEAQAKVHESASQHAGDLMQQMMDVIRDVRDKLGAMEQSRVETTRGIARNI